jgi:hypothetical protein
MSFWKGRPGDRAAFSFDEKSLARVRSATWLLRISAR